MTASALTCQKCGAALDSSSLDRRLGIITCDHCNSIFDLVKQRKPEDSASISVMAEKTHTHYRAPAALPEGYALSHDDDSLLITRKWNKSGGIKQGLFSIFFSIVWLAVVLSQLTTMLSTDTPWFVQLFLIPFVFVGVSMFYKGLADLLNTTRITVNKSEFSIRHAPLPWFPALRYDSAQIEQLYVKQHRRENRKENSDNVSVRYHYSVHAILRGGQSKTVIQGLRQIEQALFIEQEIEQHLQIRDRAVAGEYVPEELRS